MLQSFTDREAASAAAADIIETALRRRLGAADEATLVVSGGTTPERTFTDLATRELPWARVHVVPSDERWVPATHSDSNERLIRETLLTGVAAAASLLPAYDPGRSVDEGAATFDEALRALPFPFACALLGMGEDGHFASLFPDADSLDAGLDVDGLRCALPIGTDASPHARVTLTLAALSRSDEVVLLVFGAAKRNVVEEAAASPDRYPVSHLLRQKRAPVHVLWAD